MWVSNPDGTDGRAITTKGKGKIKYGTASWTYGEELGQRHAMWWSPDSKLIAYYRFDETDAKVYYVLHNQTKIQDSLDTESYVKVGSENPPVDLFVYDLDGICIRQLELPETGNVSKIFYHQESNSLFAGLSTFTAPTKIFKIDASELDKWSLYYETKVPINIKNIESKIDYFESLDGTKIPIFIIYNKGM